MNHKEMKISFKQAAVLLQNRDIIYNIKYKE